METSKERTYFLLILLGGSTLLAFLVFRPFLITVALAAVFAVILDPLHTWIQRHIIKGKGLSAFLTLISGTLIVLIPLILVVTLVVQESKTAYASLATGSTGFTVEQVTKNIGTWLEPYIPGSTDVAASIASELNTYISQGLQWLLDNAGVAFSGVVAIVLRLLIFFMTLYYFLKEGDEIRRILTKRSPIADAEAEAIFATLSKTVSGIVRGSLVIACIQGTLSGIGFALFGIPSPSLWGVTTAISALVPGVGTSLVLVPAVIFLLVTGNTGGAIGLAIWSMLMVGLIDNLLSPKLMSKGAELHPLLILLSVLGGLSFYGPVGIFMGPLTISFLFAVYTTYAGHSIGSE